MPSKFFCTAAFLFLFSLTATAQDSPPTEKPPTEKTVYVPYDKLRKVFEQPERGVFLPYDEYQRLWDAARAAKPGKTDDTAPVAAMITEMTAAAVADDETVRVEATLSIELLKDGWHEIPLRLGDAAITKALIGDEPARILGTPNDGYRVLLEKKNLAGTPANPPERLKLTLHFARGIDKSPGRNSVSFQVPQSPLSRWKVTVPDSDAKIEFFPLVAASKGETDGTEDSVAERPVKETVLEAFVGPSPEVRIAWTPKAEGATGLEALTSVQLLQNTMVDEGILRTSARFEYAIGRSTISDVTLRVPADQKVVSVFDPNIRKWSLETEGDAQLIRIELFEPAAAAQAVQVELERIIGGDEAKPAGKKFSVTVPELSAVGAGRQQGVLVVRSAAELNTETLRSVGLLRMDASELPDVLRQGSAALDAAYRVSSAAYSLELSVDKVEPRITAVARTGATLSAETLKIETNMELNVERAGVFQFSFEIPAGVRDVTVLGFVAEGQTAAEVDTFSLSASDRDGMQLMTVNLRRKALGRVGLRIACTVPLDSVDLRQPTGNPFDIPIRLPRPAPGLAERFEGRVVLFAPNAFRVNAVDLESLQAVSIRQIAESGWRLPLADAQLGFLQSDAPASLKLRAERRKPQITLREARTVRIEDGAVRHDVRIHYDILFSAVKSLRIDVPREISGRLDVKGGDWLESALVPQPEDLTEGYVAWEFSRKSELIGSGVLHFGWEDEMPRLDVGQSVPLEIPRLIPKKQQPSDRFWGRLVLSKSQSLDLGESEETAGLKPIDPQFEVPEPDRIGDAVAAFEFHDDWRLRLVATRYKLEEVRRTSIERGLVRANLHYSKDGAAVSAQALFRIRSVLQRLEFVMPPESTISDVRINGQNVVLESNNTAADTAGGRPRYMLPLTSVAPDTPFVLDIRYTIPPPCKNRIAIPSFSGDSPAVQKVQLAVFIPNDRVPVAFQGNWSKDFNFGNDQLYEYDTFRTEWQSPWVDDFPTSGKPFLFSAVHPPEDEVLELTVWKDSIGVIGFFVVLLSGLLLMRTSWTRRFQVVVAVLAACVAVGFLWTTLAELLPYQPGIGWGVLLVALCWSLQALVQFGTRLRACCPMKKAEPTPEPVATEEGRAPENA